MARNRVIGNQNSIPWKHSADMRYFKMTTLGHAVLMGRATWESLKLPRGLPSRHNIVVSRTLQSVPEGVDLINDMSQLEKTVGDNKTFVIGGASVYEFLLPLCRDLYLTTIDEDHEGDAFMPPFEHLYGAPELIKRDGVLSFWHYHRFHKMQWGGGQSYAAKV